MLTNKQRKSRAKIVIKGAKAQRGKGTELGVFLCAFVSLPLCAFF